MSIGAKSSYKKELQADYYRDDEGEVEAASVDEFVKTILLGMGVLVATSTIAYLLVAVVISLCMQLLS